MKNGKGGRFKPQKAAFAVTEYFILWALLFVVGIVFTQALRSPVSYVFMIIVLAIPFAELAYTLIARLSVSTAFSCNKNTVAKNEPVTFNIKIKNNGPLPVPFTEAEMSLPTDSGRGEALFAAALPLNGFGSYTYSRTVSFPFKGEYECRVENVYVSGLLRFFRIKIGIGRGVKLLILPRRLQIEDLRDRYVGETTSASDDPIAGSDSAEITEIKEYQPGDPMRNIHWKLSGKAQELMTKHFGSENGLNSCIIADAGPEYDTARFSPDVNDCCEDAVCELSLFAASSRLKKGRRASVVFVNDRGRSGSVQKRNFDYADALDEFVPVYAACRQTHRVPAGVLLRYSEEGVENDIIYVTSRLFPDDVTALCEAVTTNRAVTVVYFVPSSKALDGGKLEKQAEAYAAELRAANVAVRVVLEQELL